MQKPKELQNILESLQKPKNEPDNDPNQKHSVDNVKNNAPQKLQEKSEIFEKEEIIESDHFPNDDHNFRVGS